MSITFHTATSPSALELNVANRNGFVILRDLLSMGPEVESWGGIGAEAVFAQLAVSAYRVPSAVIAASDNKGERVVLSVGGVDVQKTCRVISAGLPVEQLERYVERLRALAQYALENGEEILWD